MDNSNVIDYFLEKPYWLIDILPKQVPANGQGEYFKVSDYFLTKSRKDLLCQKFINVLMKLYCYYDISLLNILEERIDNPQPEIIVEWMSSEKNIYVLFDKEDTMIGFDTDDHYMTLFNPSEEVLKLVQLFATSEGLFVWEPTNQN